MYSQKPGPIAIFDSGYGGLTVLKHIKGQLPNYDLIYLGDNARTPYGTRSFDVVYEYTLQAVKKLFELGAHLVILACNTASAKALRTIQQHDLPTLDLKRRVLGVIRPSVEAVGGLSKTKHIGIVGTNGTISSQSYNLEINKLFPGIEVSSEACPMWVPLVENGEAESEGAFYFVQKNLQNLLAKDAKIDTVILGCTHYPLLLNQIKKAIPPEIAVISQGEIVAHSLANYLQRHPEMDDLCLKTGSVKFYTTESALRFQESAGAFLNEEVEVKHITLG